MLTRRHMISAAAATGTAALIPIAARAEAAAGDIYDSGSGKFEVDPVHHASFVMQTPMGVIYNDPVGGAALYADYPKPDLILITHEHADHYDPETLAALAGPDTLLVTNPAVHSKLPEALKGKAQALANGDQTEVTGIPIRAIPAYNTTPDRLKYHPKGRDNGYVLTIGLKQIYIAGDTEDTPEMRALTGIMLAFVPMNLPYTMTVEQAASAVNEFQPQVVYPYHYKGSDPEAFAALVEGPEVLIGPWYDSRDG